VQFHFVTPASGVNSASFTPKLWVGVYSATDYAGQSLYIWGADLKASSVLTSYIPTTTAAVTRAADVPVITGLGSVLVTPFTAAIKVSTNAYSGADQHLFHIDQTPTRQQRPDRRSADFERRGADLFDQHGGRRQKYPTGEQVRRSQSHGRYSRAFYGDPVGN
jgi:hypothetical protein